MRNFTGLTFGVSWSCFEISNLSADSRLWWYSSPIDPWLAGFLNDAYLSLRCPQVGS
jgi:hypothetical protein